MVFRFRLGPLTFGRSGTRLSLWGPKAGISIPLTRTKGRTFGKIGFGPFRWFLGGSETTQKRKKYSHSEKEKKTNRLKSDDNTVITAIKSDHGFLEKLRYNGLPWRGVQERLKEELPDNLINRDNLAYNLVPKAMDTIFGKQNIAWKTEKRPSKSGKGVTTWIVIL